MIEIKNYGLAVCGGKSSRMSTDKSMLQYFDKPQRYHVYDMLLPVCEKVFISCNEEQSKNMDAGYNLIKDDETFGDIGPMKALLTAFTKWPGNNFLFIGCDYPFLTVHELTAFSTVCKNEAAAFYNNADEVYEPLLAWYPYNCFDELIRMYEAKEFSLQAFLKARQAVKYVPHNNNCIKSIDTPEALEAARKLINAQ